MKLHSAHTKLYKSIDDSSLVSLEPNTTVLVGINEAGKSAFLESLHKCRPSELNPPKFNHIIDYPRKSVNRYSKVHNDSPAVVSTLTYLLEEIDKEEINKALNFNLFSEELFTFSIDHNYKNSKSISINIDESSYLKNQISQSNLSEEIKVSLDGVSTLENLFDKLEELDLNEKGNEFKENLDKYFPEREDSWTRFEGKIYNDFIAPKIPTFLYFDDYRLLPGKVNIPSFKSRVEQAEAKGTKISDRDNSVLALLKLANIEIKQLTEDADYETLKSTLEGLGIEITDKIFKYWKQNDEIEIEFDIRQDPTEEDGFNSGHNLYIRVKNKRHRVSVSFDQRSKGFVWFFSFIVWFDNIKEQLSDGSDLILLLDEPGLNLHALAQQDLLNYFDDLSSQGYQIVYSTHSPFMVRNDSMIEIRVVEDSKSHGTRISSVDKNDDRRSLFPLQAALGYSLVQNLFVSKRNLLIEGPADLIYLSHISELLNAKGRKGLRDDISLVPCGGLDKVASFVSLLGASDLELVVLHDFNNQPDQRLMDLVKNKIIHKKYVLDYAQFRDTNEGKKYNTDVEDLFDDVTYLGLFNQAFKKELMGTLLNISDLPTGQRIVERIERYLTSSEISLRPSGGFNHYRVATYLASNPIEFNNVILDQFEKLFESVNALYTTKEIDYEVRMLANS